MLVLAVLATTIGAWIGPSEAAATVTVTNGQLQVTGDGGDDSIHIFRFRGPLHMVRVNGNQRVLRGFNSIVIKTRGGEDSVQLDGLRLTGDVSVDLGGGDNTLLIRRSQLGRDLKLDGAGGDDDIRVENIEVDGSTTITARGGTNGFVSEDSRFAGPVNMTVNQDGAAHFRGWATRYLEQVTVTGGNRRNGDFDAVTFGRGARALAGVSLDLGGGLDLFNLSSDATVADLDADLGSGESMISMSEASLIGSAVLRGSPANDSFLIQRTSIQRLEVIGADGSDQVDLKRVSVADLEIDAGPGVDRVRLEDVNVLRGDLDGGPDFDLLTEIDVAYGETVTIRSFEN